MLRSMSSFEAIADLTERERARIAALRREEGPMGHPADKLGALLDAVRALAAIGAPHAVVGGVAVGIRSGVPRATLDTDLALHSGVARSDAARALVAAGFALRGEHAHSLNFRHRGGEALQLVFDPGFDPMIARAEAIELAGVAVRVVTTPDLIAMKERAAADPARRRSKALRDRADAELLRGDVPDPDEGW